MAFDGAGALSRGRSQASGARGATARLRGGRPSHEKANPLLNVQNAGTRCGVPWTNAGKPRLSAASPHANQHCCCSAGCTPPCANGPPPACRWRRSASSWRTTRAKCARRPNSPSQRRVLPCFHSTSFDLLFCKKWESEDKKGEKIGKSGEKRPGNAFSARGKRRRNPPRWAVLLTPLIFRTIVVICGANNAESDGDKARCRSADKR